MGQVSQLKALQSEYALAPDGQPTRVLVVDDNAANRQLLVAMLKRSGFRTITAKDGLEAVEASAKLSPDLVLMDVNMPRMDGMEATRLIKEQAGDRLIPVIFVTAFSDSDVLADCMAAGGDDFVSKPINHTILMARLESQLRVSRMYREQYEQRRELSYYRDMMEREQQVVERIFRSLERSDVLNTPGFRHFLSPMSVFNGDVLMASQGPDGKTRVLVGDFTGHGLAAAIGALPTSDIFFAMSTKGFGLVEIIGEINNRLLSLLPVEMFLALAGLEISPNGREVKVWAGGIPDLVVRRSSGEVELLQPRHLPLGVVDSAELGEELDLLQLAPGDLLYQYTDGLIEAAGPGGGQFGSRRLMDLIGQASDGVGNFDKIMAELDHFRAGEAQSDDLTLFQYECLEQGCTPSKLQGRPSTEWAMNLKFQVDTFRNFDPGPIVTQLVMEIQGLYEIKNRLFTVLSELFSNALEHGLLKLDSSLKQSAEGFSRYYEQRESRLARLQEGWIRFDIRHQPRDAGGRLCIEVEDSGEGFDPQARNIRLPEVEECSGRGMALLGRLCDQVAYHSPGNRVAITIDWGE